MRIHAAVLGLAVSASLLQVSAAGAAEHHSIAANQLTLSNLVGEVRVEGGAGSAFEVDVSILGRDAATSGVRVEVTEGEPARLSIRFPTDKHDRFNYPKLGSGSSTNINARGGSAEKTALTDWIFSGGKGRVEVAGSGKGMEVWADVIVRVPAGATFEAYHGVGPMTAAGVQGNLTLDARSGSVDAREITGAVTIGTGSGSVKVQKVRGRLAVDTGSGGVDVTSCQGDEIAIDTGSGSVTAADLTCTHLSVDTGSGSVDAPRVAAESATIDTGSGSVDLHLLRCGAGPYSIDTGSGGIDLRLPAEASATIEADTGSGRVSANLPGIQILDKERDSLSARLGAGAAKIELSTGSGSIRLSS